jgi:hypothetical protein
MAADTARTATMAMTTLAATERPLWEASRSGESPLEELFCDAESEDVLVWETPALRVEVFNVLPGVIKTGEEMREIIVVDVWVVIGEAAMSALAEVDGVVVASDVTLVVGSCISAEQVSITVVVRNRGTVYIPLHLLHCWRW